MCGAWVRYSLTKKSWWIFTANLSCIGKKTRQKVMVYYVCGPVEFLTQSISFLEEPLSPPTLRFPSLIIKIRKKRIIQNIGECVRMIQFYYVLHFNSSSVEEILTLQNFWIFLPKKGVPHCKTLVLKGKHRECKENINQICSSVWWGFIN